MMTRCGARTPGEGKRCVEEGISEGVPKCIFDAILVVMKLSQRARLAGCARISIEIDDLAGAGRGCLAVVLLSTFSRSRGD